MERQVSWNPPARASASSSRRTRAMSPPSRVMACRSCSARSSRRAPPQSHSTISRRRCAMIRRRSSIRRRSAALRCRGEQAGKQDGVVAAGIVVPAAAGKAAGTAEPVPGILRVVRPEVQPGLDNSLITIIRADNELDHLAASRWGSALPKVLTAFAVESLSRSGEFQLTVATEPGSVQGNFELLLTVRHFEAVYAASGGAPTAQVTLDCMLTTGAPKRVL